MKIKYDCGCSIELGPDGYGGIDASNAIPCKLHLGIYNAAQKKFGGKKR